MGYMLFQMTSLEYHQQMYSPQTTCIYGPTTFNTDQAYIKSTPDLYIWLHHFHLQNNHFKHHCCVNTTTPFSSDLWVGPFFLIKFNSTLLIRLRFTDSIWLIFPNLTRHFLLSSIFQLNFTHHFWFNLNQFPDLILLQLHLF